MRAAVATPHSSAPSRAAHGQVAAGFQLAVGLQHHPAAQLVAHQRLVGFGQAQLPGQAGVLDGAERRGARAAVVAGHQNHVGVGLGDARRDGAHARLAHQLHVDAGGAVGVFQVKNQLRQILNRVDVVVGRGRNQPDAGRGVAHLGNPLVDLVAGQLAALAGLGALRHLDLQLVGVGEVVGRDAEAGRGNLLDGRAHGVAVGHLLVAHGVLAALAGVAAPPDAVHGNGQGAVRLVRNRAERHGPGGEAVHDGRGRLYLAQRNRSPVLGKAQQPANREHLLALLVN